MGKPELVKKSPKGGSATSAQGHSPCECMACLLGDGSRKRDGGRIEAEGTVSLGLGCLSHSLSGHLTDLGKLSNLSLTCLSVLIYKMGI